MAAHYASIKARDSVGRGTLDVLRFAAAQADTAKMLGDALAVRAISVP